MKYNKKTSIELFAGAGGLALGLERAGFEHIGLVEIDKDSVDTLKMNRPNWNIIHEDIKNLSQKNLSSIFNIKEGELDLLSGGAPCQSFSYAGKRLGIKDNRGNLFYQYATFLKKLKPKVFLFENVKGLLTLDKGNALKLIINTFKSVGYDVQYKVLNALDYKVAQKRERLIIIGIRNDLKSNLYFSFPKAIPEKLVLKDILKDVPKSKGAVYSENKKQIFSLVPSGGYWRDIDSKIAKKYMKSCWDMSGGRTGILRRLSLDEPSLTILTTPQMKQTERCHPTQIRPFNIRESARIQSFPDNWIFCGNLTSQYKQIGNAVPCNLGFAIGKEIIKMLEQNTFTLNFISEEDFDHHVMQTLNEYKSVLSSINLKKFNRNLIDPVKFLFDKAIFKKTYKNIIYDEIQRQRDKTNNNSIGFFHQNIFKYIKNCTVPKQGWDVIFQNEKEKYYVEIKNKHNTMNSSSALKTFLHFQSHLLNNNSQSIICALVEVIAKKSQNIPWIITVNKEKMKQNSKLRRLSIDKFYEIVTGDKNAFYNMCMQLPKTIDKLIKANPTLTIQEDTVYNELENSNKEIFNALYLLAFSTYEGFKDL